MGLATVKVSAAVPPTSVLYPIYQTHNENPSPYVRGVRRSGGSPEFRGYKNGIICARARLSVYVTEWGIFEIFSTKTILQTIDARKVRPKIYF